MNHPTHAPTLEAPAACPPGQAGHAAANRTPAFPAGQLELRKFTAATLSQCLSNVRSELGSDAVVLSTRTVRKSRLMGLIRKDVVEITAGRNAGLMRREQRPVQASAPIAMRPTPQATAYAKPAVPAAAPGNALLQTPAATAAVVLDVSRQVDRLSAAVGELITQVRDGRTPHLPSEASGVYRRLVDAQVSTRTAGELVAAALEGQRAALLRGEPEPRVAELVRQALVRRLPTSGPTLPTPNSGGRPRVIALVGPTGVGKTTTIAKLAANLKLRDNAKVALVTIDTYRIAAIDQLKKYADILGAPLAVVSEPREIRDAIARVADNDYVLIDTAGRSPRDSVKLAELGAFLEAADPVEVHLVLNACCGPRSLDLALRRFAGVRADRIIFTKLDEAAELGAIVDAAELRGLPLSYVTTGQDVPADIEPADAAKLASLILDAVDDEDVVRPQDADPRVPAACAA